ncbi:hypothetical protein [Nocardia macrotermitis]|uniref:YggT family protein n=1 Tax=Nocardia macrotermitis TaxID=2585198 RepID=A0A7K0D8M8_9NOCA|nr:hypothetical protein [Nocardia macrotermitis]MQY21901.1 hypothetical protein [Nocardia macrotermitis]
MDRYRRAPGRGPVGALISAVGSIFALIEIVHMLMLLFGVNPVNRIFTVITSLAESLALFFPGLFDTGNHELNIVVDYGLAAAFWLLAAGLVARIFGRL